jgi:hypothetical protein
MEGNGSCKTIALDYRFSENRGVGENDVFLPSGGGLQQWQISAELDDSGFD